jgi:hypothetical protein
MNERQFAELISGVVVDAMMSDEGDEACGIDGAEMRAFVADKVEKRITPAILEWVAENMFLDD